MISSAVVISSTVIDSCVFLLVISVARNTFVYFSNVGILGIDLDLPAFALSKVSEFLSIFKTLS